MKYAPIGLIAILVIALGGFVMYQKSFNEVDNKQTEVESNGVEVTLYKSPICGCCGVYSEYLEQKGYALEVHQTQDMESVKERHSVPYELESCHTMEVGGYVVEGHIPEEAIAKLLTERPDIKGIGMGGMPSGSPGMPGPKNEPFVIYEITHTGAQGEIFMTL